MSPPPLVGPLRIADVPNVSPPHGPISHAVVVNGLVFTSGQVPLLSDGTQPRGFREQVEAVLANLASVLEASGSGLDLVVKVNGYLTDPSQLAVYNEVLLRYLGEHAPARTTVCSSLWGVSLEVDCVAAVRLAAPTNAPAGA